MDAYRPVDTSRRALSLAREIDRLPAGEYQISLTKTPRRCDPWEAAVVRVISPAVVEPVKVITIHDKRE